jgi:hypothetical protein
MTLESQAKSIGMVMMNFITGENLYKDVDVSDTGKLTPNGTPGYERENKVSQGFSV